MCVCMYIYIYVYTLHIYMYKLRVNSAENLSCRKAETLPPMKNASLGAAAQMKPLSSYELRRICESNLGNGFANTVSCHVLNSPFMV